jgi:D-amino-acid dehydrogenase
MTARVVVVGAGAVGLSCAYFLQRAGFEVTVLDAGLVGKGASWGNAGWITPSLSAPIPGPAALCTALGSIGKPDSPLWLRPQADPGFALWGLSFLRHCTRASNERGLAATALLSRDAFRYYDEMRADGVAVDLERRGLLFIARSEAELDAELAELARLPAHGIAAEITRLSGAECRDRQPVIGPAVAGGIFVGTEGHLDPRRLTAALATVLTSRGAVIRAGVPAADFVVRDGRVTAVVTGSNSPATDSGDRPRGPVAAGSSGGRPPGLTAAEAITADHVVIAAGALSVPVTRKLGARLPMTAGKGYSVSVGCPQLPAAPMYLVETRVGATPMAGRLRLAGTIEFSGLNSRLDRRRIDSLVHAARAYFPDLTWTDVAEEWTGMRPLCPDGLPVLDRVPGVANAYLATGHSTLGITLAAVTGAHLAEFVRTGTAPAAAAPFRFPRYAGRPR